LILTGFAPTVATLLLGEGINGWIPVAVFTVGCAMIAAIAVITARETAFTRIEKLGRRTWHKIDSDG